jgi:hypothetical protein
MLLRNTSRYPTEKIRTLLSIAADEIDLRKVEVHVKNSKFAYAGMAYNSIPKIAKVASSSRYLVNLRIGSPDKFPTDNMRETVRWLVDMPEYDPVPDQGFVENVLGIEYGTADRVQRIIRNRTPYGGKESPLIELMNWQEGMVALAAHEFNHIHQYQNNLPRSEVRCEKFAASRLAVYRESPV